MTAPYQHGRTFLSHPDFPPEASGMQFPGLSLSGSPDFGASDFSGLFL